MTGRGGSSRKSMTRSNSTSQGKKKALENGSSDAGHKSSTASPRSPEVSLKLASDEAETGRSLPFSSFGMPNTFGFKIEDKRGWVHRFNCDACSLTDLLTSILQRVGGDIDQNHLPQILYEDGDHDKVVIASDGGLAAAVDHAKQVGLKTRMRGWRTCDVEFQPYFTLNDLLHFPL